MRRRLLIPAALAGAVALGTGSAIAATPEDDTSPGINSFEFADPEVIAEGLDIPWGLTFLPDGTALVAERDTAQILRVAPGTSPEVVGTVPGVVPGGEGGLLGIAASPNFASDGFVYIYYTAAGDNRVVRATLDDLGGEPIVTGIPKGFIHNGGRLAFGPDGMLYITTGESGNTDLAQDLNSLGGKILRVAPDGSIPAGNPFGDSPVYTYGHRNVQGLDWTPEGEMYASELGQNTWDEVNHIVAGDNYGWPIVEGTGGGSEFHDPIVTWSTAEASPSGAAIVDGVMYVGALRGQRLWQVDLATAQATDVLNGTHGRIRTVDVGPEGWLWLTTSNGNGTDVLVRYPSAAASR